MFLAEGGDPARDSSARPQQITDSHIALMQDIQDGVESGGQTQEQAKTGLENLAAEVGKDGLAWLLGRMPVYDSQADQFVSLDSFVKNLADSGSSSGTTPRGQEDPVGTAVDLLFGDPSIDTLSDWFGVR